MIVRSVGFESTEPLATGDGNPLRVVGAVAFFQEPLPDLIGVGDAIEFDTDGNGTVDSVAFVYRRRSAHELEIATDEGALVPTVELADEAWRLYRAHVSLEDAVELRANPSIAVPFDASNSARDLIATAASRHIACYADAPHIATVTIQGWTTSSEFPFRIFVPTSEEHVGVSQRHAGAWDPTKFLVARPPQSLEIAINVIGVTVAIEGLQVDVATDGVSGDKPYGVAFSGMTSPSTSRVSSMLVRSNGVVGAASHPRGIFAATGQPGLLTLYAWNNAFFDFGDDTGGFGIEVKAGNAGLLFNNTVVRGGRGIATESGSAAVVRNNLLIGCQWGCLTASGGNLTGERNLTSDASASTRGIGATLPTATSTDYLRGLLDAHLDPATAHASAVIGAGVELSADPDLPFAIDIDGETRNPPWDVGADEL